MSELRRYVIGLDDETVERIHMMAKDLGVSESRLVRAAVEVYEKCLDKIADIIIDGNSESGLAGGILQECRDVR